MASGARPLLLGIMLVLGLALTGLSSASAAKTITISGTVACQDGAVVTGIWVKSSNGGSGYASRTNRSGAGWISDYTYNIRLSPASTAVELHVGCGGTSSNWASNTRFRAGTISGNKAVSVICANKAGKTAYACRSWSNDQVLIGMPFTGRAGGDARTHTVAASQHVAEDLYAVVGTAAHVYAYAPRGVSVGLRKSVSGQGVCGGVNVDVTANGKQVGRLHYGHLVPTAGTGAIANGAKIGTTKWWPNKAFDGVCGWQVNTAAGVHTHVAFTSTTGYACFTHYTSLKRGEWIGSVGKTSATGRKQFCAMG